MATENVVFPFFSLVIPVYNRFELVKETIQSVLNQEFKSFEIIIVDDGSNDGSGSQLDELFMGNKQVRIIHQDNLERGAARNRGFREANGTYVVFLDSDDRLLPDHLDVLFNKLVVLEYPDFIASKFEFLSEGKRRASSLNNLKEGYYDYMIFLDGNPFGCNVCVRRGNEKLTLFPEDRKYAIKEDWLFFLKNLRYQRLYLIDQVTLLMLDHEDRSMRSNNEQLVAKTILALNWIISNIELTSGNLRRLIAHVNYFCAIHTYLDGRRIRSLGYAMKAIGKGGMRPKYIILIGKILIGRKLIMRFIHGS